MLWIGFGQVVGQPRVVHFVKFDPTGVPDGSFGTNGQLTTSLTVSDNSQQRIRAALLPDGRFMLGARSLDHRFMMARFMADGSLDTTYGTEGVSLVDPTPNEDSPYGFELLPDGSTVQTGGQLAVFGCSMVMRDADGGACQHLGNNGVVAIPTFCPPANPSSVVCCSPAIPPWSMAGDSTEPVALAIKMTDDPTAGQFAELGPDVFRLRRKRSDPGCRFLGQ